MERRIDRSHEAAPSRSIHITSVSGLGTKVLEEPGRYNGFMLVSVDSHFYSKETARMYCQWALDHLNNFKLVLLNTPQAWNYSTRKNLPFGEARNRAEEVGRDKMQGLSRLLRSLKTDRIELAGFASIEEQEKYQAIKMAIFHALMQHTAFQLDLLQEVKSVLQLPGNPVTEENGIRAPFLINDITASLYLSEFGGYPIEVAHQPEFETIKNIYAGKYGPLREELGLNGDVGYIETQLT